MIPESLVGRVMEYRRRVTPERGEEIDWEFAEALVVDLSSNRQLLEACTRSVMATLSTDSPVSAYYRGTRLDHHSSVTQSVGILGRLNGEPTVRVLYMIDNHYPRAPWVGFYTPIGWAEAVEEAEIALGNVKSERLGLRESITEVIATLFGRRRNWASFMEPAPPEGVIPPVMAMTPESATLGLRISEHFTEVLRIVGGRREFKTVEPYVQAIRDGLSGTLNRES